MKYKENMDNECIPLCDAINKFKGITTTESCCGHGNRPFNIWFKTKRLSRLPKLLFYFDSCHSGIAGWDVIVTTDCSIAPVSFRVQSKSMGERAYKQANKIAELMIKALEE